MRVVRGIELSRIVRSIVVVKVDSAVRRFSNDCTPEDLAIFTKRLGLESLRALKFQKKIIFSEF